jgi:hypothetical protein
MNINGVDSVGLDLITPSISTLTGAFDSLKTGDQLSQDVYKGIGGQVSGEAYTPYRTASNEAMVRAASNLRATTGGQFAPNIGQGSAVRVQQGVEQKVLGAVSQNKIGMAQGEQEMVNQGIKNYTDVGTLGLNTLKSQQDQGWKTYETAVVAGDFPTAAASYKQLTGKDLDITQMQRTQDYLNKKQGMDITTGELTIEGLRGQLKDQKFTSIRDRVNAGATKDEINWEFGSGTLNDTSYALMQKASDNTYRWGQLSQSKELTLAGIVSGEKIAGMNISSNETIAGAQIKSAERIAEDRNWLEQQGINLQSAGLKGYTAADGTHIMGSLEIAANEFGLKNKTYTLQEKEVLANIDNMDATKQDRAFSLYGYALDKNGNKVSVGSTAAVKGSEVKGSLGIASDTAKTQDEIARGVFLADYGPDGFKERTMSMAESDQKSKDYWDASKRFATFVAKNVDLAASANNPNWNPTTNPNLAPELKIWYKAEFGVEAPAVPDAKYIQWARGEVSAASDGRLTNPIDQAMYTIDSSTTLSAKDKKDLKAVMKMLPSGIKLTEDVNGNVVATDANDNSSEFKPDITIDPSSTSMPATFTTAGAEWKSEKSTPALVGGQLITIKNQNASVQGSSVTIPTGDYIAVDATHLQSINKDEKGNVMIYDLTGTDQPYKGEGKAVETLRGMFTGNISSGQGMSSEERLYNVLTLGFYNLFSR